MRKSRSVNQEIIFDTSEITDHLAKENATKMGMLARMSSAFAENRGHVSGIDGLVLTVLLQRVTDIYSYAMELERVCGAPQYRHCINLSGSNKSAKKDTQSVMRHRFAKKKVASHLSETTVLSGDFRAWLDSLNSGREREKERIMGMMEWLISYVHTLENQAVKKSPAFGVLLKDCLNSCKASLDRKRGRRVDIKQVIARAQKDIPFDDGCKEVLRQNAKNAQSKTPASTCPSSGI